jgi:ATP-dependent DNA ligase
LFQNLEALHIEGMVLKRKDSVYASSKSRDWLNVKTSAGKEEMRKRIETWVG